MNTSNPVTPISKIVAGESQASIIHAHSSMPQIPLENVNKDLPAAIQEVVSRRQTPSHRHHDEMQPEESVTPASPADVECKILNMSLLKAPSSISSRMSWESSPAEEASSGTISHRRNRVIVGQTSGFSTATKPSIRSTPPELLMHLLLDPANYSTMHFLPKGDAFVVSDLKEFSKSFLKKFRHTKFGCFIGQLQRWGFTHSSEGIDPDFYVFRHPLFHKADTKALKMIKYRPCSNRESKLSSFPYFEPNSQGQIGSDHDSLHLAPFQSIQDTMKRHVELLTICQNNEGYRRLGTPAVPQLDSTPAKIVEAAIACLKRDEIISRMITSEHENTDVLGCHYSNPYTQFAKTHGDFRSKHKMMISYLQSKTASNRSESSSVSQHSRVS